MAAKPQRGATPIPVHTASTGQRLAADLSGEPAPTARDARLPGLDSLRAFEAAARRLSFTDAAEELHVTQGAVSQRIKALELTLGIRLFRRLPRQLELTSDGAHLARGVREGLSQIVRAIAEIDHKSATGTLTVSVLPSFMRRWLMPRLPRFHERYPGIDVQILAEGLPVDLNMRGLDAAIRFGHGRYPGLHTTYLMADSVVPVCSPKLLAEHPRRIETAEDVLSLPLLHDTPTETDLSKSDWASWLTHLGVPSKRLTSGLRFDQADLLIEAAVLGLGVALVRTSLIADDISSGRLIYAHSRAAPTAFSYYFLSSAGSSSHPRVICFRAWLAAEVTASTASP
jgi:LysR family transcriptional regulator, glycine cleavage system transcriptional activator